MGWFVRERRGISWKDEALDSISSPPLPLLLFFGMVMMLVYMTTMSEVTETVERKRAGFTFRLLLLPVVVILVITLNVLGRRMLEYNIVGRQVAEEWRSASGLLLVLLLVLVLVYYQSSFQSAWFRIF